MAQRVYAWGQEPCIATPVDELAVDLLRRCILEAADLLGKSMIEIVPDDRQEDTEIHFDTQRRAKSVEVEEVDAISDGVLDDHSLSIARQQDLDRCVHVVGDDDGRKIPAKVHHRDLTKGLVVSLKVDGRFVKRGVLYLR